MLSEVGKQEWKRKYRGEKHAKHANDDGSKQGHWGHLCATQTAVMEPKLIGNSVY